MAPESSRNDSRPLSFSPNVTILYSMSRQRAARRMTDVYVNPPLDRVGLLEWNRFDSFVQQDYEYAVEVLAQPKVAGVFPRARCASWQGR